MTRFADPARCPDCRTLLTPGSFTCPGCALDLSGDLGRRLFSVLTEADRLLVQLRARPTYAAAPAPAQTRQPVAAGGPALPPPMAPSHGAGALPPMPPPLMPGGSAPRPAVSGLTVPRVLLGLGALTLLMAISLFFWVAWEALGAGGRTVVLAMLTVASAGITAVLARRDLRAATEALGVVTMGLVAGTVWGSQDAGWLGADSPAQYSLVLGTVLMTCGLGSALALTRTRAGRLVAGEVAAAIGGAIVAGGIGDSDWGSLATRLVVAVPVVVALTGVAHLLGQLVPEPSPEPAPTLPEGSPELATLVRKVRPLQAATIGLGLVAAATWVFLAMAGLERLVQEVTLSAIWGDGAGFPLLAAGAYVAAAALLPLPRPWRVAALGAAVLPWTIVLVAPSFDEPQRTIALVMAAAALVAAAVLATGRLPWARAAFAALVAPVPVLAVLALAHLVGGLVAYADAVSAAWDGTPGGRLAPDVDGPSWVLPLAIAALVATAVAALRATSGSLPPRPALVAAGVGGTLVAAVGWLLVVPTPVALLLGVLLAASVAAGVLTLRGGSRVPLAPVTLVLGVLALLLSAYDEWLTLAAALVLGGLAAAFHLRPGVHGWVGGLLVGPFGAGVLWTAAALLDLEGEWTALVVLLALGAWLVIRGLLDEAAHDGERDAWTSPVVGVETGVALASLLTVVRGADVAPLDLGATWLAVYLTVLGVVATVVSLTRPERREVAGWIGGALLALASWVRLADLGVNDPEPYTLPSALALLVVGWFHLRANPGTRTSVAWGPGLGLALVPTLLWVLVEPVSVRGFVLGLACLGLVLVGVLARWAAPFVWGAAVGTLLVVRLVGPTALEQAPFLVFAIGGVVLIVVGATWERRLHDAAQVRDYLRGLR